MKSLVDPLSIVEAAYRIEGPTASWLERVLRVYSQALGGDGSGTAVLFDATRADRIELSDLLNLDLPEPLLAELFNVTPPDDQVPLAVKMYRSGYFGVASELFGMLPGYIELLARFRIPDLSGLIASDPTHTGCLLVTTSPSRTYSSRTRYRWRKLAAHLTAGLRLRRELSDLIAAAGDPTERAEAILSPSHKIEHAVGLATTREGQEELRDGLARIDASRGERRYDAARAIDLWTGLIAGRWSLVEHFERGGRRYFLAYRNDPKLAPSRALTERELQVWSYAAMGQSNKLIAYMLGLSLPTVASTLRQARRKLGGDVGPQLLASLAQGESEGPPSEASSTPPK
jgi:DNA-binding CsgD family transcriptional regulator